MHDHILLPTDGSKQAERAVKYGLNLAEASGAMVHVLYVIETKANYIITVDFTDQEMKEYEEYGEKTVSDVVQRAEKRGLDAKAVVRSGRISENIVDYAVDNDIDHIVIGKQGHGALQQILGGTAQKVANLSDIPVTIVGSGNR